MRARRSFRSGVRGTLRQCLVGAFVAVFGTLAGAPDALGWDIKPESSGAAEMATAAKGARLSVRELAPTAARELQMPGQGHPLKAWRYQDVDGEHLLLVYKDPSPNLANLAHAKVEHHALRVIDARLESGQQVVNWQIKEAVDCPGLDSEAEYFLDRISITDLNQDGRMEVTVPYKTFCGGGVDPKTIKIIMRTGAEKFALRGESALVLPDGSTMGGTMKLDKDLDRPASAAFKRHILAQWQVIHIEKLE